MYRNKKDVDKYVENLFSKLSVREFRARAYSVARLYFEVGDYCSCQKYVEQYLTQKDNNGAAHRLLGQALQKLGQKEKALEQFKISLDIDATQTNLVLEICELLSDDDVTIDPGRAKYWCEKAETIFPKHPVSFRLREKLLSISNRDPETLGKLLISEMEARPKDVLLHIRLMKHYMELNQIKEVINHSLNVEFGENSFFNNYHWYETLSEILKHYSGNINDWPYQLLLLTVRERICALSLTETPNGTSKGLVESNDLLHMYDQALDSVVKAGAFPGSGDFYLTFINHHKGQFALHAATFLLKKAKKDQISWREATKTAAPLTLVAWHTYPVDPNANVPSSQIHIPNRQQEALIRWNLEGAYRCSQAGHYLLSNIQDKTQSFLDEISQCFSGTHWRDKLYEKIFINRDHLAKIKSSYLASNAFNPPVLRLPRKIEIETYDINAQKLFASSLHHMVWILLQYKRYSDFKCTLFNHKLILPANNTNCGPETLNKLDIIAFLYCATKTTQQKLDHQMSLIFREKPIVLPANITELLCSFPQMKWWDCAYKLSQNELGTEYTDIRATLSRGIEVVRCIDNHGLDPELLYTLGNLFSELAKSALDVDEKNHLETRAGLYYSAAIPLLEKLRSKFSIKLPDKRLFDYSHKELSHKDLITMLDECKLHVALNYCNENEYEKAVEILSNSKSAKAYYQLSLTYKKMATDGRSTSTDIPETKAKCCALLSKAKHFAYKALDKLKEDDISKNNQIYTNTQDLIDDIETNLNKIDTDLSGTIANNVNGRYSSDENTSPGANDLVSSRMNIFRNFSSTPKVALNMNATNYRTAVDSQLQEQTYIDQHCLERIETQIRNLQKRETTITDFMEQTRDWFEENRKLSNQIINSVQSNIHNTTEQFKQLKISVDQVKSQVDECRNDCKDVGDLKKQIAELKKEMNKLKKSSSEQTIGDRESYNLDDHYRTNDSNTSFVPQLPFQTTQVMPPFNTRLLPPFPVPPNPYQLYGQNLYNLYNQYSQIIQPPVSGGPPLFDTNRPPMNYSNVYPTPDQMYLDVAHLVPPNVAGAATVAPAPPVPTIPTVPVVPVLHTAIPTVQSQSLPVVTTKSIPTTEVKKTLPVNVVITSSDPLPTCTTAPAPVLSVTIPSKHIKGTAHNYQIPMPSTNETKSMPPSLFNFSGPGNESATTTGSLLVNWNPSTAFTSANSVITTSSSGPLSSFNIDSKSVVDGIAYSLSADNSLNKSRTLSEKSNTSIENYDPCPDFKPIIPLPAEVKVTTGEEDEVIIFSARAKLFRFVDKQWKERGLGEMKLLKHKVSGKVRVLMRREQIHKICANHIITSEMEIKPMINETKAYFWVANDFADETVVLEKFCIRFKTADIAQEFYQTFEKARQECISNSTKLGKTGHVETVKLTSNLVINPEKTQTSFSGATPTSIVTDSVKSTTEKSNDPVKTVMGGFTFSNTPTFKTISENVRVDTSSENNSNKPNIFGNFSFKTNTSFSNILNNVKSDFVQPDAVIKQESPVKLNTSETVEEFEPTVEFKPVIPLPALIDHKTGEEDEIILFEHRAKLLRYDPSSKEWKERGLGNIKLLMNKDNNQKVRLLMRREQVMKVCCNHGITKDMQFQKMPNVDKALTWCAKDFSEGELVPETFCLRFKTAVICNDFIEALNAAQSRIKDESTKAAKEEQNAAKQSSLGFGDKFKLKVGSWNCSTCYTNNLEDYKKCACCEQPKPGFSSENNNKTTNIKISSNWGDTFKPKLDTWECKDCLIRNEGNIEVCAACGAGKDSPLSKTKNKTANDGFKFNFGIPPKSPQTATPTVFGWGDKFKPKEGTWECKQCLVRNEREIENCSSCNSPKNPNSVQNVPLLGNTFESKFKFGIGETTNEEKSQTTSIFDGTGVHKFKFGVSSNVNDNSSNIVSFGDNKPTGVIFATPKANETDIPINFTLKKNDESNTAAKPALLPTPQSNVIGTSLSGKDTNTFDFVYKPKTPTKGKSPIKSDKVDESDDNEYVSEDEGHHIHFSPVIPLPNKVEVITGEENENELYAHRAKLYRFLSGEWKERGIGVVKILKNKDSGKLRVVMRREQVHKICLNHALTSEIIYTPKDEKTWLFTANDYSEGELSLQQFCLRFKSKEIALEFKNSIDKSRGEKSDETKIPNINTDDDVIFVKEILATLEEKQKAKDLMLPENFFTYKNKESCRGCRGCKDDENSSETPTSDTTVTMKVPVPISLAVSTPNRTSSSQFWSPANSLYSTPSYLNKTADNTVFRTPVELNTSRSTENTPVISRNLMNELTNVESSSEKSNLSVTQKPLFEMRKTDITGDEKPINTKSLILAAPKLGTIPNPEPVVKLDTGNKFMFGTMNKPVFGENKPVRVDSNLQISSSKPNVDCKEINDDKSDVKSVFGSDLNQRGGNIFTSNTPGSMFGLSALTNNLLPKSSVGNESDTKPNNSEIPAFTMANVKNPLSIWNFSQTTPKTDSLNNNVKNEKLSITKKSDETGKKEAVFKIDNNLSFAALSSSRPDFSVQRKSDFQWEGTGQQLFSNVPKVQDKDKLNKSKDDIDGAEEANTSTNVEEEYDPHYEPIVPLPDKIDVVTGEEDEVKMFGERCKLYRYDEQSREWKERGVGEMKILFHPKRNTYRLLLRREQVHKAVLNMLLHMDLELLPLKNSDRAWTWAGRNYAETAAGEQETLAVRFKSNNLATAFKDRVLESVRKLQAIAAEDIRKAEEANTKMTSGVVPLRLPKHLQDSARIDLSVSTSKGETSLEVSKTAQEAVTDVVKQEETNIDIETELLRQLTTKQRDTETDVFKQVHFQEDEDYDHEYDQNEDYEGYYNEEEEESPVYYACDGEAVVKQGDHEVSCPEAHIQVMYDQEVYSPKIIVTDNGTGEILADMLIHTETDFKMSGDSCSWTGTDYTNNAPVDKTVTINFHDSQVALQFYDSCETSKAASYSSTDPES